MKKEVCKTYFKFGNRTIDGFKVIKYNETYYIYTYTSCERLGNWQEFLKYNNYDGVLKYFKNMVKDFNEENHNINLSEWNKKTLEWYKNTLKQIEFFSK